MIVVTGGIKGGAGKTTFATNLAVISSRHGKKTLLVDADDQESAKDWADLREEMPIKLPYVNFTTVKLTGKTLHNQIMKMAELYHDIYIDTGGRDTVSQRSSLTIADVYLIPFKPRSFDIWTIGKVKAMVDEIATINPNLKVIVCINQADPTGIDNHDALKILGEVPDFKCITTYVGNRKAFANAASLGLGVIELDRDDKAKEEMLSVYRAIHHQNSNYVPGMPGKNHYQNSNYVPGMPGKNHYQNSNYVPGMPGKNHCADPEGKNYTPGYVNKT